MSIQMKLLINKLRKQPATMRKGFDLELLRQGAAASGNIPPVSGVSYEERTLGGCVVDIATPKNVSEDGVIFYIHGGGFVSGDPRAVRSFTSFLAKNSGYRVFGVIYRLAPEHKFPAAPEDCYAAYTDLAAAYPDKKLFLLGESAGATLVIATTLMARDRGTRMSDAVVAYAPDADFSGRTDRSACRGKDIVVDPDVLEDLKQMYCPDNAEHPYASVGMDDFHDFPPLRIVWDAGETFAVDGRQLAQKAKNAGSYVEAKEWSGTFHTFEMLLTILPEAKRELKDSIAFLKQIH